MIHGINGRLPLFFVGLAEAVLDVHSAHTNFAAKKTPAATAGWIEYPQSYKRKLYVKRGKPYGIAENVLRLEKRIGRMAVLTSTGLGG